MCGVTTTQCSPSSPVCQRTALWTTMGYGALNTQRMNKIGLCPPHHLISLSCPSHNHMCVCTRATRTEKSGVSSDQGVTVHYTNGAECENGKRASSIVHVVCGSDETITSVSGSDDGCSVEVVISSSAGCGREVKYQGSAKGGVFPLVLLILFVFSPQSFGSEREMSRVSVCVAHTNSILVGVALYFAVGMVVNWKVRGATSVVEMIPNRTFWMALPGMVVDGCKFIAHGCKKGDYVSV